MRNGPLKQGGSLPLLVGTHRMKSSEQVVKDAMTRLPSDSFSKFVWIDNQPDSANSIKLSVLEGRVAALIGQDKIVLQGYDIPKSYAPVISKIQDFKSISIESTASTITQLPTPSKVDCVEDDTLEFDVGYFQNSNANASSTMPSRTILRWEDFEEAKKNDLRKKPFLPVEEFFDTFMSELTDVKDRQTLLSFLKASDEVRLVNKTVFIDPQWLFQNLLGPIPFIRSN